MVREALARKGLSLHPGKCKLQNKRADKQELEQMYIDEGFSVDVLPAEEGFRILGTMLHLEDPFKREIDNRIASGVCGCQRCTAIMFCCPHS